MQAQGVAMRCTPANAMVVSPVSSGFPTGAIVEAVVPAAGAFVAMYDRGGERGALFSGVIHVLGPPWQVLRALLSLCCTDPPDFVL